MSDVLTIEVKNRLLETKNQIQIYHYFTRLSDKVAWNQSITFPLMRLASGGREDFLEISIVKNQNKSIDELVDTCLIDIPAWVNREFISEEKIGVAILHEEHGRTLVKIFHSPCTWKLKVLRPPYSNPQNGDQIIIGDEKK